MNFDILPLRGHFYEGGHYSAARSRRAASKYMSVRLLLAPTKKDTDLNFDTHTPRDHIKKNTFCFFKKVTLSDATHEQQQCHMYFPYICSIALFAFYLLLVFVRKRLGYLSVCVFHNKILVY